MAIYWRHISRQRWARPGGVRRNAVFIAHSEGETDILA